MADILFPNVEPSQSQWSLVSNTGQYASPFTGAIQTYDRSGERWRVRLQFNNLTAADRHLLLQFISAMNGAANRVVLRDHAYTPRGSVSASELNGALLASRFSAESWQTVTDIADGIRIKREGNSANGATNDPTGFSSTAGQSYAHRVATRIISAQLFKGYRHWVSSSGSPTSGDVYRSSNADATTDVTVVGFTAVSGGLNAGVSDQPPTSGAYSRLDLLSNSVARSFLVDNGLNSLTYSEQFDNAAWTKSNATITADATAAPNGATTADEIVENGSSGIHAAFQTASKTATQEYWTVSCHVKASTRDFARVYLDDNTGSNAAWVDVDLTDGTLGTAGSAGGFSNVFATTHDLGNGWYRVRVTARTNTATTLRHIVYACSALGTTSYTGDSSSGIYVWGAQLQKGGQLGRYVTTTSTAATAETQTGHDIWLKGLNADTDSQLVAGDLIEIDGQLLRLTSDLDGDESGVGLATVTPRIRSAPADETAAVIYRPHGRFILVNPQNGWSNSPGQNILSNVTLEFIEDIAG